MISSFNILSEENASVPQLKQNQDKKQRKALGNLSVNRVPSHRGLGLSTPAGKSTLNGGTVSVMKPQTAVKFKIIETYDPKDMVCSGAGTINIKEDIFTTEFKRNKSNGLHTSVLSELRDTSNIVKYDTQENKNYNNTNNNTNSNNNTTKYIDDSIDIGDDLSLLSNSIFDNI